MSDSERWMPIKGWPTYTVSSLGQIKGPKGIRKVHLQDGYPKVTLISGSISKTLRVQRIVCEAFHGPAPFVGAEVRHKDNVRSNCREDNLLWGSAQDNCDDRHKAGNTAKPNAALDADKVAEIRRRLAAGEMSKNIAASFGVSQPTIAAIKANRTWVK